MHGAVCPQCIMRGGLLLSTVTNRDRVAVWDTTLENNIHVLMFKNQANKLVHNTNIKTDFIVHNTLHMFSNYIYIYIPVLNTTTEQLSEILTLYLHEKALTHSCYILAPKFVSYWC